MSKYNLLWEYVKKNGREPFAMAFEKNSFRANSNYNVSMKGSKVMTQTEQLRNPLREID